MVGTDAPGGGFYCHLKHFSEAVSESAAEPDPRNSVKTWQKFWLQNQVLVELDAVTDTGMLSSLRPTNTTQVRTESSVYYDEIPAACIIVDSDAEANNSARSSTETSDVVSLTSQPMSMTSQGSLNSILVAQAHVSRRPSGHSIEEIPTIGSPDSKKKSEVMPRRLSREDKFIVVEEERLELAFRDEGLESGEDKLKSSLKEGPISEADLHELTFEEDRLEYAAKEDRLGPAVKEDRLEHASKEDKLEPLENSKHLINTTPHTTALLRRRPKTSNKISYTAPRRTGSYRFRVLASELTKQQELQAQVLRAQQATLEAQAALIQASRPRSDHEPGWGNLRLMLAILVTFALWSLVLVLCMTSIVQRTQRS